MPSFQQTGELWLIDVSLLSFIRWKIDIVLIGKLEIQMKYCCENKNMSSHDLMNCQTDQSDDIILNLQC